MEENINKEEVTDGMTVKESIKVLATIILYQLGIGMLFVPLILIFDLNF